MLKNLLMIVKKTYCLLFKHFMSFLPTIIFICSFIYTKDGQTALYIASEKRNNECVQLLLEVSANPDIADHVSCDKNFIVYYALKHFNQVTQRLSEKVTPQ